MNPRYQRFVEEYLIDLNATRAYRAAYPKAKQSTADTNGPKLLGNAQVSEAIKMAQAEHAAKMKVSAERVLRELARVAFADHRKLYHQNGRLKAPHEFDDDTAATIASLQVEEGHNRDSGATTIRTSKVRQLSKVDALNSLGRHLGMFDKQFHVVAEVQTPSAPAEFNWAVLSEEQRRTMTEMLEMAFAAGQPGASTEQGSTNHKSSESQTSSASTRQSSNPSPAVGQPSS
jgi:phage terminase small subunit